MRSIFLDWRRGALLVAALVLLSSCDTVVVDEGRPGPLPGPAESYCTREYDPVCGRRGGESRTFANACLADRAGYRIAHPGQCRRPAEPRFCTREYDPVCGRRGERTRTFPNECEAQSAGYRVVHGGECRPRRDRDEEPAFCTREYRPVCARQGESVRTFPNACEAGVARYRVIQEGPC
ncbi:hypothetical protein KEU06_19970 [Pseudaminobacter sp. 19-2017]|uniref:Kazal-like domain-containing protein n=1 Tax=Pseudaminobacter soli (ex Zhang et al. 2022) TaxID=2831468 RepID=A0A942E0L0_9HYPH|nr:Kazal-type serine protease inhibitor domain-containing protein [Pseudaminobacter soli]MBS3650893.1 hypothetical protein [Pseudaminobacter soli]